MHPKILRSFLDNARKMVVTDYFEEYYFQTILEK